MADAISNAFDKVKNAGCDDVWCPTETQIGTKWFPWTVGNVDWAGSFGSEKSVENAQTLFILFAIQVAISLLPTVVGCLHRCCGDSDTANKKQNVAGGGSTATTFLIGIFGICAIKFDCKELLIASTITALISLVLIVLYLLVMLCGMCALCREEDSCCGRFSTLILFVIGVVWVLASSLINILIVYYSWPFCFNQSIEKTIDEVQN